MTAAQATDVIVVTVTTVLFVAGIVALALLHGIRPLAWCRDRQEIRRLRQQVADLERQLAQMTAERDRAYRDVDHFADRADWWYEQFKEMWRNVRDVNERSS